MIKLNGVQKQLAEQMLILIANKEFKVTYQELGESIQPPMFHRNVGPNIGEISKLCIELSLPPISIIVVNKNSGKVGGGFYSLLQELGINTDGLSEWEVYEREIKRINECQEWHKLDKYLELDLSQLFNVKEIRILPMSSKLEFPEMSYWEIQKSYFLDKLIEEGYYYFRDKGMIAPEGSLVLFRINNTIIASATLNEIVNKPYDNVYKGAYVFDTDSIEVFEPITAEELALIDSNFHGFIRNKQKLDYKNISKIKSLIESKKQPMLPEELSINEKRKYVEGSKRQITVNAYERNDEARKECIRIHGNACGICGFKFGIFYGEEFSNIIHVHHIKPLNEIDDTYEVDPKRDLIPICPNCHAVIHSKKADVYSIAEMKKIVARKKRF